jgi:hypothetical protein
MRILFLLIISTGTFAQKKTINQNLNYFRYQINISTSSKNTIKTEFENRSYLFLARQNQFIAKFTLENNLKRGFVIGNGIVYSKATSPQDPKAITNNITNEIRPFVFLQHHLKVSDKSIFLTKLTEEARFFKHEDACYQYGNIRSRIQLEYDFDINKNFTLKLYEEVLFNFLGNRAIHLFDQQRISLATQYNINKHFGFELAYQNWYQKQSDGITYLDKNILKATIIQKIRL